MAQHCRAIRRDGSVESELLACLRTKNNTRAGPGSINLTEDSTHAHTADTFDSVALRADDEALSISRQGYGIAELDVFSTAIQDLHET